METKTPFGAILTPDEKRRAYYALPSGTRKEMSEMTAFMGFVEAANPNVDAGSAVNGKPPLPDICCKIGGAPYLFELGEITDEELVREISTSQRTLVDGDGCFLSEPEPLARIIRRKASSTYRTDGVPLDLVLYYDKQYPFAPADYLKECEVDIAAAMVPAGPYSRIWIYASYTKAILWKRV
jgi:hypothetical protein